MFNIESHFLGSRRTIRKLKTTVNVLEETINILEEALEESLRLRAFVPDPEQWLQLWANHISSFRTSIRDYYFLLQQSSLIPQQATLIHKSLHAYSAQVTEYVELVQAYCLSLLSEGGDDCFLRIEERINRLNDSLSSLAELADLSLVKNRLTAFKELVLRIELLIDDQASNVLNHPNTLGTEELDNYRQLVTFLQVHIITWEGEIALYEEELNNRPFSIDRSLETSNQIRSFMADLGEYVRLVQKIYRNLLEG